MRKHFAPLAAAAVVGSVALVAAPASAAGDYQWIRDNVGDGAGRDGLTHVRVSSQDRAFIVRTTHQDLRRRSSGGMTVRIDTNRRRQGAEFRLTTGLGRGTDYVLLNRRGNPVDCRAYRVNVDWAADTVRARIGKGCLRTPAAVRVHVVAHGTNGTVDHAPNRGWMNWVTA